MSDRSNRPVRLLDSARVDARKDARYCHLAWGVRWIRRRIGNFLVVAIIAQSRLWARAALLNLSNFHVCFRAVDHDRFVVQLDDVLVGCMANSHRCIQEAHGSQFGW